MAPTARYAHGTILLVREDGSEVVLTRAEARAVAEAIAPAADAMRATVRHLSQHKTGGLD